MNIILTQTKKTVDFLQAREAYKALANDYNEASMVLSYTALFDGTALGKKIRQATRAGIMQNPEKKAQFIATILQAKVICSQK